jgi:hypothetical protein
MVRGRSSPVGRIETPLQMFALAISLVRDGVAAVI